MYLGCRFYPFVYVEFFRIPLEKSGLHIFPCTINCQTRVQPHHLRRKAVIYIRQSTGHQVLTNLESQQLQHAMREHAHHLGWPDARLEVVETDMGRTAQSPERRDG